MKSNLRRFAAEMAFVVVLIIGYLGYVGYQDHKKIDQMWNFLTATVAAQNAAQQAMRAAPATNPPPVQLGAQPTATPVEKKK